MIPNSMRVILKSEQRIMCGKRALREAFGEHFINMRTFMIEQGLETAGLEPTEQDLDDLENGRVPEQLKDDYTHFNSYGYYAMGAAVYHKGVELGYW